MSDYLILAAATFATGLALLLAGIVWALKPGAS